jgi:uncharacterized RDD family membrane protein YckC
MTGMLHYGGFRRRIIAFLIDNILLQVAIAIVFILGLSLVDYEIDVADETDLDSLLFLYYAMFAVMNLVYFTWFHGITGQTIGKRILGLKVVRTTGESMNLGIAFLRWVGYIISSSIFYLGFIWIAFDQKKRGWHDRIAGTLVIKTGSQFREKQPDLFRKMP